MLKVQVPLSQGQFESFIFFFFGLQLFFFVCALISMTFAIGVQSLKSKYGMLEPEQFC